MKNLEKYKDLLVNNTCLIYGYALLSISSVIVDNDVVIPKMPGTDNIINLLISKKKLEDSSISEYEYDNILDMCAELHDSSKIRTMIISHETISYDKIPSKIPHVDMLNTSFVGGSYSPNSAFIEFEYIKSPKNYIGDIDIMIIYVKIYEKIIPLTVKYIGEHVDADKSLSIKYKMDIGEINISADIINSEKFILNAGDVIDRLRSIADQYTSAYGLKLTNNKGEKCTNISINKNNEIVLTFEEY